MKKIKLLIVFIVTFMVFVAKPVFALPQEGSNPEEASDTTSIINVCDSGCEYTTINSALRAIENAVDPNVVYEIIVTSWNEQSLTNHTLKNAIRISFSYTSGVIRGTGATITSSNSIGIYGNNVELTDTNFLYTGEGNDLLSFIFLSGRNVHLKNVSIRSQNQFSCDAFLSGITNNSNNLSIENTNIYQFTTGLISSNSNLSVSNCDLENNIVSISTYQDNGSVSNSRLSSCVTFGNFQIEDNNVIDSSVKVKILDSEEEEEELEEDICTGGNKYLYVVHENDDMNSVSVQLIKSYTTKVDDTKTLEDVLAFFKEKADIDLDDFEFEYSDPDMIVEKNGNITFIKDGEVSIIAKNADTSEQYTLRVSVSKPFVNPYTGRSYLFLVVGIVFTILVGIVLINNKRIKEELL